MGEFSVPIRGTFLLSSTATQIVSNVHRTVITDVTHAFHGIAFAAQASRLNKSVFEISEDDRDEKLNDKETYSTK